LAVSFDLFGVALEKGVASAKAGLAKMMMESNV
jgi:hypothetical protein